MTMKKHVLIIGSLLAVSASPALSQSIGVAVGTVDIRGTVGSRCQVVAPDTKTINVGEMTGNSGILDPTVINNRAETLSVWCNQASASMEVEALPLLNTASVGTGFTNRIDYTATATIGGISGPTANDTSTTSAVGAPTPIGLSSGTINVVLSNAASNGGPLLIAGAYSGRVLVTLRPNTVPPAT
jgi:type 1 fimbria pilin